MSTLFAVLLAVHISLAVALFVPSFLLLYAANLALAFFVQRPALARLIGRRIGTSEEDLERWRTRARRQRYVSYVMAAAVGLIAFLMSAKPPL